MARIPKTLLIGGAIVALLFIVVFKAPSEIVDVKYRGYVDLKYFSCTNFEQSSIIRRVCYDRANKYMLIFLNGVYYHYCEIDSGTVTALTRADSMGRYTAQLKRGLNQCKGKTSG